MNNLVNNFKLLYLYLYFIQFIKVKNVKYKNKANIFQKVNILLIIIK